MAMGTTRSSVIERARRGLWEDFLRVYPPIIFVFAIRRGLSSGDAEDVVQEVMADVVKRMPTFRYQREKGGFKAFLRAIVYNKVVDRLRRRRPAAGTRPLPEVPAPQPPPDDLFDKHWMLEHVRRALELVRREVKPSTYQSFELYVLKEQTPGDVARFLRLTANQVIQNKRRVIQRIRAHLRELQDD